MPHEYVQRYEAYMRGLRRSPRTIRQRSRWARHVLKQWPDPGTATTSGIVEWLGSMEATSVKAELSSSTLATYFGDTKAFFRWLAVAGLVQTNPLAGDEVERPRHHRGLPKGLSETEEARALEHAHKHRHMKAYLLLGLRAGLRASEIAAFRGESINEGHITLVGKGGKEAAIPTGRELWQTAQEYPRRGWWFPSSAHDGHISGASVTILVGRYFRLPEVDIPKGSVHRCRHTYGTTLIEKGVNLRDVRDLMRHSSSATTDIYTRVADSRLRSAIDLLGPDSAA